MIIKRPHLHSFIKCQLEGLYTHNNNLYTFVYNSVIKETIVYIIYTFVYNSVIKETIVYIIYTFVYNSVIKETILYIMTK